MRKSLGLLLTALLAFGAAAPVAAEPEPPQYTARNVYFVCHGGDEEKNQNLYDAFAWSSNAPNRSILDGAGCGYVNSGAAGNRPVFEGTFTGNLRELTVELHIFPSVTHPLVQARGNIDLDVTLTIDDAIVQGVLTGVPAPMNGGNYQLTNTVVFSISGLDAEFGQEEGPGTTIRDISLAVGAWTAADVVDWVWGTSEVPAGIRFNSGVSGPVIAVP